MNRTIKDKCISLLVLIVLFVSLFTSTSILCAETTTEAEDIKTPSNSNEEKSVVSTKAQAAGLSSLEPPQPTIFAGDVGKGALLSPLLSESFQTDLATGSATVSVPIVTPPGRKNMQPTLALAYSSNSSDSICGVGWGLGTAAIQRSTKKGIPKYDFTDTFMLASSGSAGELILIDEQNREYRQKNEGTFARYFFDEPNLKWNVVDKNGLKYTYGSLADSRISDQNKIFAWFLDKVEDIYGNYISYIYEKDTNGQTYLKEICYTGAAGLDPNKTISFNYDETRPDKLYNYRTGWKIETIRRLKEIQIKVDNQLKWKYVLSYEQSPDTGRSILTQITVFDGEGNSLPSKKFKYQTIK